MTLRTILVAPDPVLKAKAKPVEVVDDAVRQLMDDMLETMYQAPGICPSKEVCVQLSFATKNHPC